MSHCCVLVSTKKQNAAILRCGMTQLTEAEMALDTHSGIAAYDAPEKDLYEIGEMPPLGYVPKKMYAWAIRP